jgi:hypothetical protein
MEHAFNVEIAKIYDVDLALFIQNLKHWTLRNLANKKHIHDGYCWTFNTLEALCDIFPYWTSRQLQRIIARAVDNGLVKKGNYNTTTYDRTCWYALTSKSYEFFPELNEEKYVKLLISTISPNGEMDLTKRLNGFHQTVTPIPDTKTDTKTDTKNKPKCVKEKLENLSLEEFEKNNPHGLPGDLFLEWKKMRKKPITLRVLNAFNKELSLIAQYGITPIDAVNKMLDRQWSTVELKFFANDIAFNKTKSNIIPINQNKKQTDYNDDDTSWIEEISL